MAELFSHLALLLSSRNAEVLHDAGHRLLCFIETGTDTKVFDEVFTQSVYAIFEIKFRAPEKQQHLL